ncbi:MAG: alpha/beta hydrolase [Oscillospiraceae bacterium]|nr:alpha/beta hydrolase [Oscillospiraceae bacterium]
MSMNIKSGQAKLTNGETLFCREAGSGEKNLILLHGQLSSSRHMEPLMPLLGDQFHIYNVDMRGFGDSSYHNRFDTLDELSEDIADFCRVMKIKKASFAGWSTGGAVLMTLAANHPDLVENLIMIAAVSYKGWPVPKCDERFQIISGSHFASKAEMAKDPRFVGPILAMLENKNHAAMMERLAYAVFNVSKPSEQEGRELTEALFKQRCCIDIYWALDNFNISTQARDIVPGNGKINAITCPVLWFWGDSDLLLPRDSADQTFEAFTGKKEKIVLERCAHYALIDRAQTIAEEIKRFTRSR